MSKSPFHPLPDVIARFLTPALKSTVLLIWRWDLETNLVEASDTLDPFLNPEKAFTTLPFDSLLHNVHSEDREYLKQTLDRAIETGEACHAEVRYHSTKFSLRWLEIDCHLVLGEDSRPRWVAGTAQDITARKQEEDIILNAAKAVSASCGTDYAHALVTALGKLLGIDSTCIALRSETDPNAITSIARYFKGKLCPTVDYSLENSPFTKVLEEGFYICPHSLKQTFPKHPLFQQENFESYIGVALTASDGSVLGLLHAAWNEPIRNVNLVKSVFQFFAVRAGAEMERALMEERVRRQTRLMEQTEQAAHIGGWELNCITNNLYWTPETYHLHETTPQEYTPTVETAIRFYTPESIPLITQAVNLAITQSRPFDLELQLITAKGRRIWVRAKGCVQNEGGMVIRAYGSFQDITEEKLAQQALQQSQANLTAIIESTIDVIFSIDTNYRILTMNTETVSFFRDVFGATIQLGDVLADVLSNEIVETWIADLERGLQGESFSIVRTIEWSNMSMTVEVFFNPIFTNGEVAGLAVHAVDITERIRRQQEITQSQKLEALGKLAGGVAHDFNNYLLVIMGYTNLLEGVLEAIPEARKYTEQILRACEQAETLTYQMRSFARRQHISPTVFDLNQHIQTNSHMLLRLIGEHIELNTEWNTPSAPIKMDASQLNQVLMNLVINARDAMPQGGIITLSTHFVVFEDIQKDIPTPLTPGEYYLLQVTDTGTGMSKETIRRVFEPLFTTKGVGKGTGFGLSTCYGIIKQAGGMIYAESELGRGATFSIYLPVCKEPLTHPISKPEPLPVVQGGATILLVEDDVFVRDITATILKTQGYEVIIAETPVHAVEIAQSDAKIELLLTDVVMPQMNGRQVAEAVLALRPSIKVLFMSGYTQDVFSAQDISLEGIHLLPKPFTSSTLALTIQGILDTKN